MPDPVNLAPRMNLQATKTLHARLAELTSDDVTIDASAVEFLGGLAAQTLVAAQRTWRRNGRIFALRNCSAAFWQSLDELGMRALLVTEGGLAW